MKSQREESDRLEEIGSEIYLMQHIIDPDKDKIAHDCIMLAYRLKQSINKTIDTMIDEVNNL